MARYSVLVGLAAGACICLTACGHSHPATTAPAKSTTTATPATTSPTATLPRSAPTPSSGGAPSATTTTITITNFHYRVSGPAAPNDTVRVRNTDSVAHTVTADSGHLFDVNVPPGATATFTAPGKPGTYAFHCRYHGNMHGTLTVR